MFRVKYSREIVLKILFQLDILHVPPQEAAIETERFIAYTRGLENEEREYIRQVVQYFLSNRAEIDRTISENLISWRLDRLTVVDRSLLRMGISEAHCSPHGNKAIIIDDIIRIAKKYSDQDSFKIINAILDKVLT